MGFKEEGEKTTGFRSREAVREVIDVEAAGRVEDQGKFLERGTCGELDLDGRALLKIHPWHLWTLAG